MTRVIPVYAQPETQGQARAVTTHRRRRRPGWAKVLWIAPLLLVAAISVPVVSHLKGTGNVKALSSTGPTVLAPRSTAPNRSPASSSAAASPASASSSTASQGTTGWYAAGEAAAVQGKDTPGFNDGENPNSPGGIAQNATAWCADLLFNQQPASLSSYLQSHEPPTEDPSLPDETQAMDEWADGCEAAAPFGSGQGGTSGDAGTTAAICELTVDFNSGAVMTIAEPLSATYLSCDSQAADLTANASNAVISTYATLNTMPEGYCSLDGATLVGDTVPNLAEDCESFDADINGLVVTP